MKYRRSFIDLHILDYSIFYYLKNQRNDNLTVVGDGKLIDNKSTSVILKNQQKANIIIVGDRKFILNGSTHVYEVNGKSPIWLYRDNENVPIFGLILIESTKCVNPEFEVILVHDSTIKQFWSDLHGSSFLNLTKKSSCRCFSEYYNLLTEYELVGGNWYSNPITITHLGPARTNILLFKLCTIIQWELIKRKLNMYTHYPFYWGTIGQIVFADLPKSYVFSTLGNLSWSFLELKQTSILYFHSGREKSLDRAKLEVLPPVEDKNIFSYMTNML